MAFAVILVTVFAVFTDIVVSIVTISTSVIPTVTLTITSDAVVIDVAVILIPNLKGLVPSSKKG